MKHLVLVRDTFTEKSTIGRMYLNGEYLCETLEDRWRPNGEKVYGETCIPEGVYSVKLVLSLKRGIIVPLLIAVLNFTAIEIHIGNFPKDTLGCILVGMNRGVDHITESTVAFKKLMSRLQGNEDIMISVIRTPEPLKAAA